MKPLSFHNIVPTRPVPASQKANVIDKLVCPGCSQQYIGKTDRSLAFRLCEHARREEQPMYQHVSNCENFKETVSFCELPNLICDPPESDFKEHIFNQALRTNFEIINSNDNWLHLAFLDAFYINNFKPSINEGIKASKELDLFL